MIVIVRQPADRYFGSGESLVFRFRKCMPKPVLSLAQQAIAARRRRLMINDKYYNNNSNNHNTNTTNNNSNNDN